MSWFRWNYPRKISSVSFSFMDAKMEYHHYLLRISSKVLGRNLLHGYGKKALDIGCSYGYVVKLLQFYGYEAVGLDLSRTAIFTGKKVFKEANFVVADAFKLPFKSKFFNLITAFEVMEHLPYPRMFIKVVHDSLKEDGVLILTTPRKCIMRRVYDFIVGEHTHVNLLKPEELKFLLKELFNYVKVWMIPYPIPIIRGPFRYLMRAFLKDLDNFNITTSSYISIHSMIAICMK